MGTNTRPTRSAASASHRSAASAKCGRSRRRRSRRCGRRWDRATRALVSVLAYVGPRTRQRRCACGGAMSANQVGPVPRREDTHAPRPRRASHGAGPGRPRGLAATQCTADRRRARVPSPGRRGVAQGRLEQLAQPGVPAGTDRRRPADDDEALRPTALGREPVAARGPQRGARWPSGWGTRRPCRSTPTATCWSS